MRTEPPQKLFELIGELADKNGWQIEGVHISTPYVCDHCKDAEKEAFPYHVNDSTGKRWDDLCNDCFDELGCNYDDEDDECNQEIDLLKWGKSP